MLLFLQTKLSPWRRVHVALPLATARLTRAKHFGWRAGSQMSTANNIKIQPIEWWDIKFTFSTCSRIHWTLWVAYSKVQHLERSFKIWHVRLLGDMMIDKWCPLWYPQRMISCCNKCIRLSPVCISNSIELKVKRCIWKIDSIALSISRHKFA